MEIIEHKDTCKILGDIHFQSLIQNCMKVDQDFFSRKCYKGFKLLESWKRQTDTYGLDVKATHQILDAFMKSSKSM